MVELTISALGVRGPITVDSIVKWHRGPSVDIVLLDLVEVAHAANEGGVKEAPVFGAGDDLADAFSAAALEESDFSLTSVLAEAFAAAALSEAAAFFPAAALLATPLSAADFSYAAAFFVLVFFAYLSSDLDVLDTATFSSVTSFLDWELTEWD